MTGHASFCPRLCNDAFDDDEKDTRTLSYLLADFLSFFSFFLCPITGGSFLVSSWLLLWNALCKRQHDDAHCGPASSPWEPTCVPISLSRLTWVTFPGVHDDGAFMALTPIITTFAQLLCYCCVYCLQQTTNEGLPNQISVGRGKGCN